MTTQGYELIGIPTPALPFVHIHPDAGELTRVYRPELAIVSTAQNFLDAARIDAPTGGVAAWADNRTRLNQSYQTYRTPTQVPGALNMGEVFRHFSDVMPNDTIITNGAGNYAVWLHRFHQHRRYRTQLAPTSGSMGYGVPAAVAAKLTHPDRTVVSYSGDGCFLMLGQEMATAAQNAAPIIYMVLNNGIYGTIRMHQEKHHPGRVIGTNLHNPDFVAYAKAFGLDGEQVADTAQFPAALARARAAPNGYMIELLVDPDAISPSQTLSGIRAASLNEGVS